MFLPCHTFPASLLVFCFPMFWASFPCCSLILHLLSCSPPFLNLPVSPRSPLCLLLPSELSRVVCPAAHFCSRPRVVALPFPAIESFSAWLQGPFICSSESPVISLGRDAFMQGYLYWTTSYSQGMEDTNHLTLSAVLCKQHP